MSYGTIAVYGQMPFSNDNVLNVLDTASTPPPARAPDALSSTR
jgi:hypothetical protein